MREQQAEAAHICLNGCNKMLLLNKIKITYSNKLNMSKTL